MEHVIVYIQPDCVGCQGVQDFLKRNSIPYTSKDINTDPVAYREFQALGLPATPVTVVGQRRILGFNRHALVETLGLGRAPRSGVT